MGQKINPIIFRQSITKPEISSWISKKDYVANLQQQDLEIRNFMGFLLRSQGILLRSCKISRSSRKLLIEVDFYFSSLLAKQSKFFWAKNLFRTIKKKYVELKKMRDLKNFVEEIQEDSGETSDYKPIFNQKKAKYLLLPQKRKKAFLHKKKQNFVFKTAVLTYKHRFFFYLLQKKKGEEKIFKKDKFSILGSVKKSSRTSLLRLRFGKLKKLFVLKKFKYNFQNFHLKDSLYLAKNDKKDLLELNKALCRSLHNFTGFEDIHLRIYSTQLNFLPTLKLYRRHIEYKLVYLQRSKDLRNYFSETLEILYFVLGTFTYGNAALLGKLISYMIETNRKHTNSVRFIKKSLQIFFQNLPTSFFAVDGIKILIKGRFNKRRRTKTIVIQEGQISLQTIRTPIDYYQTQAITLYGAFGIKVWLAKKL
jgi:hypothetical protein